MQAHKNQLTKRKETNGGMTSMMKKIVGAYIFFFLFFSYTNFNIYNKEKHNSEPRQITEKKRLQHVCVCVFVENKDMVKRNETRQRRIVVSKGR